MLDFFLLRLPPVNLTNKNTSNLIPSFYYPCPVGFSFRIWHIKVTRGTVPWVLSPLVKNGTVSVHHQIMKGWHQGPSSLWVLKVLIFVSTPSASYYIQSSHICPHLSSYSPIKTRWRLGAHRLLNFSALSLCSPSLSLCLVKFPSRESFDLRNSSGPNHSIAYTHYLVSLYSSLVLT